MSYLEKYYHRMVCVGKDLKVHLAPTHLPYRI